MESEDSSAQQS